MFFGRIIEKILKNKTGQDAIIEIDNILSKIFYNNPEKLSEPEMNVVLIEELEREINNGGFNQYFFNSAGNYTVETINALKIIKSKVLSSIFQNAISRFPNGIVPINRFDRQKILLEIDKEIKLWTDLNNEYFKYEEDIYKLLLDYINIHIKDFR